jgi:hypothetical protein
VRARVFGVLVCGLMLCALAPGVADGKTVLTLRTAGAGVLPAGTELEAVPVYPHLLTMPSEGGNWMECPTESLGLVLASNNAAKDAGTVTSGRFGGLGPSETLCNTTTCCGEDEVAVIHQPWPFELTAKGTAEIKKGAAGKIGFSMTFPLDPGHPFTFYEASKVKGTFSPGPPGEPAPVVVTLPESPEPENIFKHNKKMGAQGGGFVPTAQLRGSVELLAGGEPVLAET